MTLCVLDETGKQLAEENIKLVPYIVNRYFGASDYELDDLISIGNIGLCNAATKYKPDKGIKFSSYAAKCIVCTIIKELVFVSRQKRGGGVSTISLNSNIWSSDSEDLDEMINTIQDDTVDVESQAIDNVIFDSIAQYVPTFLEIERKKTTMSEYAKAKGMSPSAISERKKREINMAKRKLNAGTVVA